MDVFYFAGIALVIAALVIAYVGISAAATFPPSRPLLAAGIAVFAVIVGTTMAFAVDAGCSDLKMPSSCEWPWITDPTLSVQSFPMETSERSGM